MTTEEQRIAIAHHCGWKETTCPCGCGKTGWSGPKPFQYTLPDYLEDLNAIHGAIMRLPVDKRKAMRACLWELTDQMSADFADAPTMAKAYLIANGLI